jgi:hypothetical protein
VASARSSRQFCETLHAETGGRSRWTTIVTGAKRMGIAASRLRSAIELHRPAQRSAMQAFTGSGELQKQ